VLPVYTSWRCFCDAYDVKCLIKSVLIPPSATHHVSWRYTNNKWRLNPVWHRMYYSIWVYALYPYGTMATVGFKRSSVKVCWFCNQGRLSWSSSPW